MDLGELHGWFTGRLETATVPCPTCGYRAPFADLDLDPSWCLAETVVRVWNWAIPQDWFIRLVHSYLTPRTISLVNKV
ncbi:MAG: hypothetical protein KDA94_00825 [Acidimicrobiales bacterium]|nr:hypothetical protein [Acidimicrobiales bacterium]